MKKLKNFFGIEDTEFKNGQIVGFLIMTPMVYALAFYIAMRVLENRESDVLVNLFVCSCVFFAAALILFMLAYCQHEQDVLTNKMLNIFKFSIIVVVATIIAIITVKLAENQFYIAIGILYIFLAALYLVFFTGVKKKN